MNTKLKTQSEALPRVLGRPVGGLTLGLLRPLPPGQKRPCSVERKHLKRASSSGSISSLSSQSTKSEQSNRSEQSIRSEQSTRSEQRSRPGTSGHVLRKLSGKSRSQNENEGSNHNIRVLDNSSAASTSVGSLSAKSSWEEKNVFTTSDILKLCQEMDVSKVFEIDLHGKDLTCVPDLEKFHKLRILDLSGNSLRKISGLNLNKELRELKLYDNGISTIEGLENLKDLHSLQLQHNKIASIGRNLGNLKKLHVFRLDNNHLMKIEVSELISCSYITTLDLSHNRLESLASLSYLPNLEELFASKNKIKNTGDITRCKKLQEVDLSRNKISDLSGLANLPNLQILDVSHNLITTLKSLAKLRSLEELNINGNNVKELSSFVTLFPNLQILFACDNIISQWDEVYSLSGCLDLVELYLTGNPCTTDGEMTNYHQKISQTLPSLEVIDGVTLKKVNIKPDIIPLMRPMSASQDVSVRQIDTQLTTAAEEQNIMLINIAERFTAIRTLVESLPKEVPTPRPAGVIMTPSSSRCSSSRSKLKDAQNFAAVNFDHNDDGDEVKEEEEDEEGGNI